MVVAVQLRRLLRPGAQEAVEGRAVGDDRPMLLWARLVPPASQPWGAVEGVVVLLPPPRDADAAGQARSGGGARIEVTVPLEADDTAISVVRERLGWLADHGLELEVLRDQGTVSSQRAASRKSEDVPLRVCSPAVAARLAYPAGL